MMFPSRRISRPFKLRLLVIVVLPWIATASADAQQSRMVAPGQITQQDLSSVTAATAWDAVAVLRPLWLRGRGSTPVSSEIPVRVLLNGIPAGDLSELRAIPVNSVASIQFFRGAEAVQRWGPSHASGVIVVQTARRSG